MHVFVEPLATAAERTGVRRSAGGKGVERAHVDADQLLGCDTDEVREGAIDAENVVLLVVDDDEVADRVEHFHPVAVGLLHAGEQAGVLERDAGVPGDGAQQLVFFDGGRGAAVGETKHADQFPRGAVEPDQGAIGPSQLGGEIGPEHIAGRGEGDIHGVLRQGRAERLAEAAEQRLIVDFGNAAHQDGIWLRCLEKAEGDGSASQQSSRAQSKVAHELRQMQDVVEFERDGDQGLGAAAVLLGLVQVAGKFERDGNLRGQSARAPDVLVVDRPRLGAVEHSEHPEHIAVRTEQRHSEELTDMESRNEIQIRARSFGGVFGEEHIFLFQRSGPDAIVERDIEGAGDPVLHSPANVEYGLFEEPDEAALEAEETGGTDHRGLHELVELSGGTEFEGNLEDFVQFVSLGTRHAVQLGVGDGNRAKAGQGGDQGFVFLGERVGGTGIDQNRTVRARGAKGRRDQNSGRRIFSEMRGAVDAHRNALAGGDGAGGDLERRAELVLLETRADGEGEPWGLGRHRLQPKEFLLLDEDENGGRMQQHAEAVGDALHHGGGVGQAMQCGGDLDQNAGAAVLFAGKPVQAEGFQRGAELGGQDGDFGYGVVVEAGTRRALQECDGAGHFPCNQQRGGQGGVRVA